jgi:molybdopterin/thiamine biosynthesis adenylyltransferase
MNDIDRYNRQIPVVGEEGQRRLSRSTALVVGAGGLGSIVSYYLVAAGIGKLVIVDNGIVEVSNLNRQILYTEEDINKPKVVVAVKRLKKLNSDVVVEGYYMDVYDDRFEKLVKEADVVIDCLDNWRSRFRVNDIIITHRKPMIHAGIYELYGQLMVILPGKTPCLACVIPRNIAESEFIPILGVTPGILGLLEVNEAIKIITGKGTVLTNELLAVDLSRLEFHKVRIKRRVNCPACGGVQ